MIEPIISVIIPVYNMEKYVLNCLESVRTQTFKNFEVIIVNDGSTDRSEKICKEFIHQNKDKRFKILSKTNEGISEARNYGITHSSPNSRYITFIDSDDEISTDCLKSLIANASHDMIVIGSVYRCNRSQHKILSGLINNNIYLDIWNNEKFLKLIKNGIINSCCGKCYSLDIIRKYDLKFENTLPEDTIFNVNYLKYIHSVVLLDRAIYYYFVTEGSITTEAHEVIYKNYIMLQEKLYSWVHPAHRKYIDQFAYPHYRANSIKYIKNNEIRIPKHYLKHNLVKNAFKSYHPVSIGDYIVHFCLKNRIFGLLNVL